MGGKTANKAGYFDKLKGLLEEYRSIFIVSVDNVSSQQMHEIRQSLRGEGVVLMGKNTMVCQFNDQCGFNYGQTPLQTKRAAILTSPSRSAVPSRASSAMPQSTSVSLPTSRVTSVSSSPTVT